MSGIPEGEKRDRKLGYRNNREFPGSPMVRTLTAKGPGSTPDWATNIPQATWHGQKKKEIMAWNFPSMERFGHSKFCS